MTLANLRTKIFADGADLESMRALAREPYIKGFTTNPTLMRKAGVSDYRAFAQQVLAAIPDRPVSFEVFSDEFQEMERQAREIATWGEHVYVKIPVTNTKRVPAYDLIDRPNEKPWGAGEPTAAVVPSAIANAIYDATGARLRSVPFTPDKVLAALKA